jgi:hypothetical protein
MMRIIAMDETERMGKEEVGIYMDIFPSIHLDGLRGIMSSVRIVGFPPEIRMRRIETKLQKNYVLNEICR